MAIVGTASAGLCKLMVAVMLVLPPFSPMLADDGAEKITVLSLGAITKSMSSADESISQLDEGKPPPSAIDRVRVFSSSAVWSSSMEKLSTRCTPLASVELAGLTIDDPAKEVSLLPATMEISIAIASSPLVNSGAPSESFSTAFKAISSPSSTGMLVATNPIVFLAIGVVSVTRIREVLGVPMVQPSGSEVGASVTVTVSFSVLSSSGTVMDSVKEVEPIGAWATPFWKLASGGVSRAKVYSEAFATPLTATPICASKGSAWEKASRMVALPPSVAAISVSERNPIIPPIGAGSSLSMI